MEFVLSIAVPVDLADAALAAEMAEDLAVVEAALQDTSFGGDEMFADVSRHMMQAGGKRFRCQVPVARFNSRLRHPNRRNSHESHFRQSEVQNLGMTALGHENVCRLDVPMHDASGVSSIESIGDLNPQRQHSFHLH
jgi:hypothetical protein